MLTVQVAVVLLVVVLIIVLLQEVVVVVVILVCMYYFTCLVKCAYANVAEINQREMAQYLHRLICFFV